MDKSISLIIAVLLFGALLGAAAAFAVVTATKTCHGKVYKVPMSEAGLYWLIVPYDDKLYIMTEGADASQLTRR